MHTIGIQMKQKQLRGLPFIIRGGGTFLLRTNYLFQPGSAALKNSNCTTCLSRIVLKVNYLFHAEFALFQKYQVSPPP